jgi:hypothetical protein
MRAWSDRPFDGEVSIDRVVRDGPPLANDGGESRIVHEIAGYPGWVAKLYKRALSRAEAEALASLIELPESMGEGDRSRVDRCTAWPTARIVSYGSTAGVVMAKAPVQFFVDFKLRGNRVERSRVLSIDWLIGEEVHLSRHDIEIPSIDTRQRIAGELLALGDLFERFGIVYGDWSYRNSLWSANGGGVFLLDMDSCRLGKRPWMESPEWEDPLYPAGELPYLDFWSDRYKIALLAVRCITGVRGDPMAALQRLPGDLRSGQFGSATRRALTVTSPRDRPSVRELLDALRLAGDTSGNVVGRIPIKHHFQESDRRFGKTGDAAAAGQQASARPSRSASHEQNAWRLDAPIPKRAVRGTTSIAGPVITLVLIAILALILFLIIII